MELLIGWVVCALVGALIGQYKGRVVFGVLLGILLGPIGWLIVALTKDLREKCSECGGVIVPGARKCRHCGSETGDQQFREWKRKQEQLRHPTGS